VYEVSERLLCRIAAEKRPSAGGEDNKALTLPAPADWPKIVTWEGSPPKALILA